MADTINKFVISSDPKEQAELIKQYQKIYTTNVNTVGLVEYPGALIINKRFKNVPNGAPIYMFQLAEDSIIRERLYVPAADQGDYQLFKDTLPGKPGGDGPQK